MYYAASWMRQPIPRYGGHMLTCRESQSRPQKPRSFRSAPRIQTAGLVGKPSKTMAKSDWLLKIRSFHIQSLAHAHIQFLVPVCESPRAVKCSVNAADSYPVASRIPNLVSLAVHLGKDNSSFPSAIARVNWRSQTQRFFFLRISCDDWVRLCHRWPNTRLWERDWESPNWQEAVHQSATLPLCFYGPFSPIT